MSDFIIIMQMFSLGGMYLFVFFRLMYFLAWLRAVLLCIKKTGLFNGWRRKIYRKENPAYSLSVIFLNLNNRLLHTVQWYSPFEMDCMLIILIICILLSFWKHITNVRESLPTHFTICNPYYLCCHMLKWYKLLDKATQRECVTLLFLTITSASY